MVYLKSSKEIEIMKQAGRITALALAEVERHIKIGVSTKKLDEVALSVIEKHKAQPSFKKVPNYKHCICATPNNWVVHGIPGNYFLKKGDIIGIDLGAFYKGYHSDMAKTYLVEDTSKEKRKFLKIGDKALREAIKEAKVGNRIGDISSKIQSIIGSGGYSIVKELVGHGIGKDLHEDPLVPGEGKKGVGPEIKEGMVLAIEVIYNMGKPSVVLLPDGWTITTKDKSYSGLFEKTCAVTSKGPVVLTQA